MSFGIVVTLTIISVIIYGFDITVKERSGPRKALTSQIKNTGKTYYYYKVSDEFAIGVNTEYESGEADMWVTKYTQNYVPYCFFCGWYTDDLDDDRSLGQPYMKGDILYNPTPSGGSDMGLPEESYPTLNVKTGEFSHVMDLSEIDHNAESDEFKITREWVSQNFDEISFSAFDDEDCFIAFSAIFFCYIVLIIWGIIALIVRKK